MRRRRRPQARAAEAARPAQIAGHPNLNGVWQAIGIGSLEPRGSLCRRDAVLAAGRDVRDSCRSERGRRRHDPVSPRRAEEAGREHEGLAEVGSRSQVLHGGDSALDLHALSVPDRPGTEGHPLRVRIRQLEPHRPHGQAVRGARRQLDGMVERQVGRQHARDRSDREQRSDLVRPRRQPSL